MSIMTLYAPPTPSKRAKAQQGWFARFCERIRVARMHKAHDVFKQHVHLLPAELQLAAIRLAARNEKDLPFIR